jgi:DNA-binding MarR family transcriptional regulator
MLTRSKKRQSATPEPANPRSLHAEKMQGYLPHYLSRLYNVLNLRLLDSLRPHKITIPQFRIMQMLDARKMATIGEIAADTVIEQSVVSRIVDQLERAGLAERRKRVADSRYVDVHLTPHGSKTYALLFPHAASIVEDAVSGLTATERDVLEALLSRMFDYVAQPYEPWKKLAGEKGRAR